MNEDEFEQRLQSQPAPVLPPEWRERILAAAQQAALSPRRDELRESLLSNSSVGELGLAELVPPSAAASWRLWFAKFPVAWSALAALWIGLVGVNWLLSTRSSRPNSQASIATRALPMAAWNLHSVELLLESPDGSAEPAPSPTRPRSERLRHEILVVALASPGIAPASGAVLHALVENGNRRGTRERPDRIGKGGRAPRGEADSPPDSNRVRSAL